jgi:hypothetical protein
MKVGQVTSAESTARDNAGTASGQPKTDARTVLEHTISIQNSEQKSSTSSVPPTTATSTPPFPPDLTELAALWHHLPSEFKTGFLAAARAVSSARR